MCLSAEAKSTAQQQAIAVMLIVEDPTVTEM